MASVPQSPISVQEALDRLLRETPAQPAQFCELRHAAGRILNQDVKATHDSPPFDTSAMDGYAVRAKELEGASRGSPVSLPLQAEVIAGDPSLHRLTEGCAIRINTGAPLPLGADAVVRVEDVEASATVVRFVQPVAPAAAIRRAGEDYRTGTAMLHSGRRLDPTAVGLLASLGMSRVLVARAPRVALIASGNEIIEPGQPLGFGQIYNSTRHALIPLLASFGAEVHDLGRVSDTPEETRKTLANGLEYDVLITTGGVSMGSHDFIRPTLLELGVRQIFWKVKQRPGMPLFVGKLDRNSSATICFGLPGNPVSVFVTALVYARAALLRMQSASQVDLPWTSAAAAAPFPKNPGLTHFVRADYAASNRNSIVPSRGQGSHQFSALGTAAGLVRLREASSGAAAGDEVDFLEFAKLF